MMRSTLLFCSITVFTVLGLVVRSTHVSGTQTVFSDNGRILFGETCQEIASTISAASAVFYDGSPEYERDINHWVVSAAQCAACSFEPGTVEDVGVALRILGRTRTPFAIKGGGHSTNPGFSSSPGVQIAMSKFSEVIYDSESETVTFGAGLVWDDVYAALEPYGRSVAGGRLSGVGAAGYTLGGGYSWITNQHGLTLDTVQRYELVMPNGTAVNVTESSSPDLFFALKGGGNNFGIVTRFTLKTFPQTQVWGGTVVYDASTLDQVIQATANFAENYKDPKAAVIMTYNYSQDDQQPYGLLLLFYDAPWQPAGVFDEFLRIHCKARVEVQPLLSLTKSMIGSPGGDTRGLFNAVSTPTISVPLLELVVDQLVYWGEYLNGSISISYGVQPFLPTLFEHNTTSSAYPPDRTRPFYPLSLYATWQSPEHDEIVHNAVRASAKVLQDHITRFDHCDTLAIYPNYAIFGTPLIDMFGSNLPRLQAIHEGVDPQNVMGLTGGFKF